LRGAAFDEVGLMKMVKSRLTASFENLRVNKAKTNFLTFRGPTAHDNPLSSGEANFGCISIR
jgi:hypothetical protein